MVHDMCMLDLLAQYNCVVQWCEFGLLNYHALDADNGVPARIKQQC